MSAAGPERRADFLEGPLGRLPERRAGQRVEEAAAEIQRGRLVEGETEPRPPRVGLKVPLLAAELLDRLPERKAGRLKRLQVAAGCLLAHGQLLDDLFHRHAAAPGRKSPQENPLAYQGHLFGHNALHPTAAIPPEHMRICSKTRTPVRPGRKGQTAKRF